MSAPPSPKRIWSRLIAYEPMLTLCILAEAIIFAFTATNFATPGNAFEIIRLSSEVGILALALTPVILTGGIDLSVGSLLGLCAVAFGALWRDCHLPPALAALCTLGIGAAAGGVNALLITRLQIPPLIVTLGSYSLFRGIAEGLTGGVVNYTGFPDSFLFLGQGYFFGIIPAQAIVFAFVAVLVWLVLHRTFPGRALRAIGFSPEGARYTGIPVKPITAAVYLSSGFFSAVAALIYVAHVGQAKADAGSGYELLAITAVVLGGASIFGGSGGTLGTLLGIAALAILRNGLALADLPSELGGILTGALLLAALIAEIAVKRLSSRRAGRLKREPQAQAS